MRRALFPLLILVAALASSSCGRGAERGVRIAAPMDPGEYFLLDLERRLLRATNAHVSADVRSEGAVRSALSVELHLGEGQRARLEVKGVFEGREVSARFVSDGTTMQVRGKPASPAAPELRDALVLGFVRMGILHNAALLIGGAIPDHADGGVHAWVKAERARAGTPAREVGFVVVVRREVMGEAVLTLDESARPLRRRQLIHLEEGDLQVEESYPVFELDAPEADSPTGALFSL
jgi:hypothetical protein